MHPETTKGLTGVTYGKEAAIPLTEFAKRVYSANVNYTIKRVPDLSHSLSTGFPVPAWDFALSAIEGRECVNPAPKRFAEIIKLRANGSTPTVGYAAYSEGLSDDYNKMLWSATTLEPSLSVDALTAQYVRTFLGAGNEKAGVAGLFGLESNWAGALSSNPAVLQTLAHWESIAGGVQKHGVVPPLAPQPSSWRLDMHYYRALKDAFIQGRQQYEYAGDRRALSILKQAHRSGADNATAAASSALASASNFVKENETAHAWRDTLAALYQAINTSAALCPGCATGGAGTVASQQTLLGFDRIESTPLSDAPWIAAQMVKIKTLPSEQAKLAAITCIVNRLQNPPLPPATTSTNKHRVDSNNSRPANDVGSIGNTTSSSSSSSVGAFFYDWLGGPEAADRPHLNPGQGLAADPMNFFSPLQTASPCTGRHYPPGSPQQHACVASCPLKRMTYAGVSWSTALQMEWPDLDPTTAYTLHISFPGELTHDAYGSATRKFDNGVRISGGRGSVLYGPAIPVNISVLSLSIPRNETAGGNFKLVCDTVGWKDRDLHPSMFGANCRISEVWLVQH